MSLDWKRRLLLTGPPGCGKTTLVQRVVAQLPEVDLAGFITEEIRESSGRVGFRLLPIHTPTSAPEGRIVAHCEFVSNQRVGRYGVDVEAIAYMSDLCLRRRANLFVVDEIGKMECLSVRFVEALRAILADSTPLLATVSEKGGGIMEKLRTREDLSLVRVGVDNRDGLVHDIVQWAQLWGKD